VKKKSNAEKSTSEYGQMTKIGLSEGCGGKTIPMAVALGYAHHGFLGYLRRIGKT
jgi:hypothetical protein